MELEITIRVPLGGPISVEESTAGAELPREEVVQWPPSPADLGLATVPAAAELAPPPLEMVERLASRPGATNGPPGLEEFPIGDLMPAASAEGAEPPDLPDFSELPPAGDEFAPPPIDEAQSPPLPDADLEPPPARAARSRRS